MEGVIPCPHACNSTKPPIYVFLLSHMNKMCLNPCSFGLGPVENANQSLYTNNCSCSKRMKCHSSYQNIQPTKVKASLNEYIMFIFGIRKHFSVMLTWSCIIGIEQCCHCRLNMSAGKLWRVIKPIIPYYPSQLGIFDTRV